MALLDLQALESATKGGPDSTVSLLLCSHHDSTLSAVC
ncbi:SapB/AmfS family lantipeptide [Planomonospora sp. ID67723]|nr:SapB/AmfS family lanthipeptide [Planomonospora sp. ID67723]MBG0831019.1 SapB/AmfS family lantipeptide [Planomonospora sp. ID67723]